MNGLVAYFGYGSLVNRDTHRTEIVGAYPARLKAGAASGCAAMAKAAVRS
ncbi:hypothetical protein [Nitratireductor aquibiodomus]|nr:hypothetical protein [Nitratireductor aquibiodomus]